MDVPYRKGSDEHLSGVNDESPWLWLLTCFLPAAFNRACTFVLVPNAVKHNLVGLCYAIQYKIMKTVNGYIGNQPKEFYSKRIQTLNHCSKMCIALKGGYVET